MDSVGLDMVDSVDGTGGWCGTGTVMVSSRLGVSATSSSIFATKLKSDGKYKPVFGRSRLFSFISGRFRSVPSFRAQQTLRAGVQKLENVDPNSNPV